MANEDMRQEKQMVPPVKVGDIIENQEVINSGRKNDGVVKYNGYIIFVNDCKQGDTVSFKIDKVLPKFGIATKIVEEE
jgi:predicted RNA-binding protein with TRAM domain